VLGKRGAGYCLQARGHDTMRKHSVYVGTFDYNPSPDYYAKPHRDEGPDYNTRSDNNSSPNYDSSSDHNACPDHDATHNTRCDHDRSFDHYALEFPMLCTRLLGERRVVQRLGQ